MSHPGVWEAICAEWEPFGPSAEILQTQSLLCQFFKGKIFAELNVYLTHSQHLDSTMISGYRSHYFGLKLSQKQQETEGG